MSDVNCISDINYCWNCSISSTGKVTKGLTYKGERGKENEEKDKKNRDYCTDYISRNRNIQRSKLL